MGIRTRTKQGSIQAFLQASLIASCIIASSILIGIGILTFRFLGGSEAMLFLIAIGISIVLLVASTFFIYLLLRQRIDAIFLDAANSCRSYAEGKSTARIPIYGTDSFAVFAHSLNSLFEKQNKKIEDLKTTNELRAYVHESTNKRSDPKKPASVKLMPMEKEEQKLEQTEKLQKGSQQVTKAIRTIVERTAFQEQASRAQAIQIFQTSEKLENLALSVHQLARNVEGSTSLAQTSLSRLHRADETLNQAARGMETLQRNTQRAAQQIYGLSEHTYTMRELVSTIEQIATQMMLLSEQALLQTDMVGESDLARKQLNTLLQDLLSLAAQIADSATEVGKQMQNVESASQKAVVSLQEGNRDVTQKAKMVQDSGQILRDVHQNLQFQSSMLRDLAQSANEQSVNIDDASASMGQIAKMAYQSSKETQLYVQGLKKVASMSEQLTLSAGQAASAYLLEENITEKPDKQQRNA